VLSAVDQMGDSPHGVGADKYNSLALLRNEQRLQESTRRTARNEQRRQARAAARAVSASDTSAAMGDSDGARAGDDAQPAARALLSPTLGAVRARKRQRDEAAALALASISTPFGERGGARAGDGVELDGVHAAAGADSVSPATAACLVALAGEDVRGCARYARLTTALLSLYQRRPAHFGELPDGKFSIVC